MKELELVYHRLKDHKDKVYIKAIDDSGSLDFWNTLQKLAHRNRNTYTQYGQKKQRVNFKTPLGLIGFTFNSFNDNYVWIRIYHNSKLVITIGYMKYEKYHPRLDPTYWLNLYRAVTITPDEVFNILDTLISAIIQKYPEFKIDASKDDAVLYTIKEYMLKDFNDTDDDSQTNNKVGDGGFIPLESDSITATDVFVVAGIAIATIAFIVKLAS